MLAVDRVEWNNSLVATSRDLMIEYVEIEECPYEEYAAMEWMASFLEGAAQLLRDKVKRQTGMTPRKTDAHKP
jgi:hypothetical protein